MFGWLAKALAWFYELSGSYGVAIMLLTVSIMIVLTPLTLKGTRSMMAMQRFGPEMKRIQAEFKHDRQRLNEEMLAFYREHKINPVGGCLPMLVQMPVFIVLWRVLSGLTRKWGATCNADDLKAQCVPGNFHPKYLTSGSQLNKDLLKNHEMLSFGLDLSKSAVKMFQTSFGSGLPYVALVVVYAGSAMYQQRQMMARSNIGDMTAQQLQQQKIMKFLPLLFSVVSLTFAAGLLVYLVTSNLYRVAQQAFIAKTMPVPAPYVPNPDAPKSSPKAIQPKPATPRPVVTGRVTPKANQAAASPQRRSSSTGRPSVGRNNRQGAIPDKKEK